jgi:3-oxoacyl-[acyl-carrier protein] reductase
MHDNKVALLSGAATGIGRACALSLAAAGFTIAANFRSKSQEADDLIRELAERFTANGPHQSFQADVSDPAQAESLIARVMETYGRVDVLVNAAGMFSNQDIFSPDFAAWTSSWQDSLRVNLHAPVNLAYLAAQQMIRQGSGTIINITSRGAYRGEPTAPAYGAAKAGLNSASQSLAVALAPHGISVFAIAPGWVETPMASPRINGANAADIRAGIPLGRVGRPDEIANLVTFLAGDNTQYLTGAVFDANGASYLR